MVNQQEQCTVEPVPNYENQPGLELDFRKAGLELDHRNSGLEIDPRNRPLTYITDTTIDEGVVKDVPEQIFGFKKKNFIIVAVVTVTILVMAVVAGIIGGVISQRRRSNKPHPPLSSPSPPAASVPPIIPATNMLQNSSIASVNWTLEGLQYYGVFYQDRNSSIVMSLWDPKTSTWIPSPIAIDNVYSPLPGTHIAACAWNSTIFSNTTQVNVYITSKNDELLEFWTRDPYAGKWNLGDLTNESPRPMSLHGSELAAYYWGCSNRTSCLNAPVLLYQTTDQLLKYTNARNGWAGDNFLESTFEPGAVMALMSLSPGGNDFGRNTTSDLKAYIGTSGNIAEYTWDSDRDLQRPRWENRKLFVHCFGTNELTNHCFHRRRFLQEPTSTKSTSKNRFDYIEINNNIRLARSTGPWTLP